MNGCEWIMSIDLACCKCQLITNSVLEVRSGANLLISYFLAMGATFCTARLDISPFYTKS